MLALELDGQHVLQTGLGGCIGQAAEFVAGALHFGVNAGHLLLRGPNGALQFRAAGVQAALGELSFLRPTLQAALLFAAFGQLAFGLDHAFVQLGVALLRVGQLHVQLFKAGFGRHTALLQLVQQGLDFGQVVVDLSATGPGLGHQLRQAKGLDLQLVRAKLAFAGFAANGNQSLRGIGVSRFGPHQRAAAFFRNQGLGAQLLFQILDFLGAAQQTGLLGVWRIENHAVELNRMTGLHQQGFTRVQLTAPSQRVIDVRRGVAALQPVCQQGRKPSIMHTQKVR